MRRIKLVATACLALLALSGCNKYGGASRYCEREQRVIPDAELKGRLLLNMRKSKSIWGKLPDYMETYLQGNLPENATDPEIQAALSKFVTKNPLCCQFTYNFDLFENYYTEHGPGMSNDEYFANFYVISNVEWFQDLRRKTTKEIYHVGVRPHGASSNCGDVTVFDQG